MADLTIFAQQTIAILSNKTSLTNSELELLNMLREKYE